MSKFEWRHDGDLAWQEVEAADTELAARLAARRWDKNELDMIRTAAGHIFEIRDESGAVTLWVAWGEARPFYYTRPFEAAG